MILEKIPQLDNELAILYTTINSLKEAERLAREALLTRLVASINLIPGMQSMYLLDDNIKSVVECVMIFKTTSDCLPELEKWLLENHPYDLPAILKWDVASSEGFCRYISNNVQSLG